METNLSEAEAPPFEWACDEQKQAFESWPGPLLLLGGFGASKTAGGVLKMLALMDSFPGYVVAVLRKTYKDLVDTTWPTILQWIPEKRIIRQSQTGGVLELDNGGKFVFHHMDKPNSATVLKGLEINAAFIDQAEQIDSRVFDILHGRLGRWRGAIVPDSISGKAWPWLNSSGKPVPPAHIILTANPAEEGDPETHWLWRRFHHDSPEWKDKWSKLGYRQIVFDSRKNKFSNKQNLDILLTQDDDYIARYVRGEWVRPKGGIFKLDDRSILEPDAELISKIKYTMVISRTMDHGDSAPTCVLWVGVDGEGRIFVWREYYVGDTLLSQHRKAVWELSKGETYVSNICDPTILNKTRGVTGFTGHVNRWSIADEWSMSTIQGNYVGDDHTAVFWTPGDNSEPVSRIRLKEYLRVDPHKIHPIDGQYGSPSIFFLKKTEEYPNGCDRVIREIRAARRLRVGGTDDEPIFSEERDKAVADHALDAIRYFVTGRPAMAEGQGDQNKTSLTAASDGRVTMTVPPVNTFRPPRDEMMMRRRWRTKAGGY